MKWSTSYSATRTSFEWLIAYIEKRERADLRKMNESIALLKASDRAS